MSTTHPKGFSGIVQLVSKVEDNIKNTSVSNENQIKPNDLKNDNTLGKDINNTGSDNNSYREDYSEDPFLKYLFIATIVFIVFIIFGTLNNSNKKTAGKATQSNSSSQTYIADTSAKAGNIPSTGYYIEPPFGSNNILSIPMIRWCLKEEIRLDYFKSVAVQNSQIVELNTHVDYYNNRCGSYRYQKGNLSIAKRDVEKNKAAILNVAVIDFAKWNSTSKINKQSSTGKNTTQIAPELIGTIQELLQALGYNPGAADKKLGPNTINAIKSFQRDAGLKVTGKIDPMLVEALIAAFKRKNKL